jgi:crotonobetaine/carnitine-CoA ligase
MTNTKDEQTAANRLVLDALAEQVKVRPDRDFLRFCDSNYTYVEFAEACRNVAGRLAAYGVSRHDIVPAFFPNSGPAVEVWFALMHLGAIWAPINTEFRGKQLIHALNLMESDTLIVDAPYLEQIMKVLPSLRHVRRVILHGVDELPEHGKVEFTDLDKMPDDGPPPRAEVERAEVAMIQFTSGSSGVSKAVQLSHGYLEGQGSGFSEVFGLGETDVLYCPFPLYHWDATVGTVITALKSGSTAALARKFSVSGFWDDIHFFGATVFDFMGATLTFIYRLPERPDDADNPVRFAWGVPMPDFKEDFERRFDLKLMEGYGSTEGGISVFQYWGEEYPPGSCGRAAPGWNLKIVDDDRNELPAGTVGELITKPDDPNQMMSGYFKMPEVNAELIRDGWYHTGDLCRLDEAGNLYFAGRKKDVIRRRGENMSALEIEHAIDSHPDVSEVAAYGVPSEYSEEEVAVSIVVRDGCTLTEQSVLDHCAGKMARYMIPEHILFLEALPKTPTEKVAKAELKKLHADLIRQGK